MDQLKRMAATVVQRGSMRAAARELHMTPSAVSQQIRTLEQATGASLLHRSTRRLTLTQAGERYHTGCAAMLAAARSAEDAVASLRDAPEGELRIAAPVRFARLIAQTLGPLLTAHPRLSLSLLLDDAPACDAHLLQAEIVVADDARAEPRGLDRTVRPLQTQRTPCAAHSAATGTTAIRARRLPRPPARSPRMRTELGAALLAIGAAGLLLLGGCGTTPSTGSSRSYPSDRDGPLPNPPADLEKVPDAEPRVEPIRPGGANKPYAVDGKRYEPLTSDAPLKERGLASWYGRKFQGRQTASGETYNMYAMTAAHPTMPLPSYARVRNPANGKEIIVRVNDRGPFHSSRVIDLSYTAALKLGLLRGVGIVELERITNEDIRSAAWRRPGDTSAVAATGPAAPQANATVADSSTAPAAVDGAAPSAAAAPPVAATVADSPVAPAPDTAPIPAPIAAADPPRTQATTDPAARSETRSLPVTTATAPTAAARGFWVQLGAFRQRDGAITFQRRVTAELDWLAPLLAVFNDAPVHRLQAGPYASKEEAGAIAERVRDALKLVPVIVERR